MWGGGGRPKKKRKHIIAKLLMRRVLPAEERPHNDLSDGLAYLVVLEPA